VGVIKDSLVPSIPAKCSSLAKKKVTLMWETCTAGVTWKKKNLFASKHDTQSCYAWGTHTQRKKVHVFLHAKM
jgi:hypothetical protein